MRSGDAVAIRGDSILAVGFTRDLKSWSGPETRVLDAAGAFLCPGFILAHVQFLQGGANLNSVQLRDAATRDTFIRRIADFAQRTPAGTWITGGDWNHELWGGELPDRSWIDSVTAGHPVFLNRLDGHMALANTQAMELAGITAGAPDVPGGAIVRETNGRITGVFKDNAMDVFYGPFGDTLLHPRLWHLNRHSAAGAVAVGMFCGLIPGPFQMLGAALCCVLLRVNLPLALFTTLYTNPFTIVPLYLAAFSIGEWILGGGGHFTAPPEWSGSWSGAGLGEWMGTLAQWMLVLGRPLALGLIALATALSATAYLLVRIAWRQHLVRAWQRRKKCRS